MQEDNEYSQVYSYVIDISIILDIIERKKLWERIG